MNSWLHDSLENTAYKKKKRKVETVPISVFAAMLISRDLHCPQRLMDSVEISGHGNVPCPLTDCGYEWDHLPSLLPAPALQPTAVTCLQPGHFDRMFDGGGPEAEG